MSGRCQPAARLWTDVQLCHLCSDCCQIPPSIRMLWFNICREFKSSACALLVDVQDTAPYRSMAQVKCWVVVCALIRT